MKAKDLMIGDWFAFRGHPYRCTASDIASLSECKEVGAPTDISEIPITPEILEKNGFAVGKYKLPISDEEIDKFSLSEVGNEYVREVFLLPITMNCTWSFSSVDGTCIPVIKYVHELQHALRLCGIEHDIIL